MLKTALVSCNKHLSLKSAAKDFQIVWKSSSSKKRSHAIDIGDGAYKNVKKQNAPKGMIDTQEGGARGKTAWEG